MSELEQGDISKLLAFPYWYTNVVAHSRFEDVTYQEFAPLAGSTGKLLMEFLAAAGKDKIHFGILKDALKAFDGTLIVVSHDRDFLDGLAEKVFEFGNKRVREHFEDINGFLKTKKLENLNEIERKN